MLWFDGWNSCYLAASRHHWQSPNCCREPPNYYREPLGAVEEDTRLMTSITARLRKNRLNQPNIWTAAKDDAFFQPLIKPLLTYYPDSWPWYGPCCYIHKLTTDGPGCPLCQHDRSCAPTFHHGEKSWTHWIWSNQRTSFLIFLSFLSIHSFPLSS